MLESLTHLKVLFSAIPILKLLYPKTRMKKKIIRELTGEANRDELLIPEIRLRDNLVLQRPLVKHGIFLKNFYELFIESIRDLETEGEIMRMYNWDLEFVQKDQKEEWPAYSSEARKTPAHYGLKADEPKRYLALNSQEAQDLVKSLKDSKKDHEVANTLYF